MRMTIRRQVYSVLALALTLTAAACSTSNSNSGSSASTAGAVGSSSAGTASSGAIDIGLANMDTGTTALPAVEQGAMAAVKYLNATGGLDGKRINLVNCDVQNSDQMAQECGQQFANDSRMPFALLGATINGGAFYSAMEAAHKPVLGAIGITSADDSPSGVYFYYPGADFNALITDYFKQLHVKSMSSFYEQETASEQGENTIVSGLAGTGTQVKGVAIPATAADFTPEVASSGAGQADLVYLSATRDCVKIAQAMQSLGVKPKAVVAESGCIQPSDIQQNPSLFQGWTVVSPSKEPGIGSGIDADVTQFLKEWGTYGPGGTPGTFAELGWGLVMTLPRVFTTSAPTTTAVAQQTIASYKGAVVMGPSSISCPGPAPFTSTCGNGLQYYRVNNGKMDPIQP